MPDIIAAIVRKPTKGVYRGCKFIKKKLPVWIFISQKKSNPKYCKKEYKLPLITVINNGNTANKVKLLWSFFVLSRNIIYFFLDICAILFHSHMASTFFLI